MNNHENFNLAVLSYSYTTIRYQIIMILCMLRLAISLAGLHLRGGGGASGKSSPPLQNFKLKSQIHQQQLLNACVCGGYCVLYIYVHNLHYRHYHHNNKFA